MIEIRVHKASRDDTKNPWDYWGVIAIGNHTLWESPDSYPYRGTAIRVAQEHLANVMTDLLNPTQGETE